MMYVWSETMGFGPLHWPFFIVAIVAVVYPIGRILSRLGSPLWSLVTFVPFVNLVRFGFWPPSIGPTKKIALSPTPENLS